MGDLAADATALTLDWNYVQLPAAQIVSSGLPCPEGDLTMATRNTKSTQQAKLDKYAIPKPVGNAISPPKKSGETQGESDPEPTLKDVMAAIAGVKDSLEHKMETIKSR